MKIPILIASCLCWASGLPIDFTHDLISNFVKQSRSSSAVIFYCWDHIDNLRLAKSLTERGISATFHNPADKIETMELLRTEYYHMAVIMDDKCTGSLSLLKDAFKNNYHRSLHHWLLLSKSVTSNLSQELIRALEHLHLRLDSRVTVARPTSDTNQVILQDVYKIERHQILSITPPRYWSPGQIYPPVPKRDNYGGVPINSATVVIEANWENFLDIKHRHSDTLSKCNYVLMSYISAMLNFTMNITIVDTWGYPRKDSHCYDGIVGLMECGDVEIGAVGLLQKNARLERIDYAGETIDFGGKFMFLKPSLPEVSIIYSLPFKSSVWIAYVVTVCILTVALHTTQQVDHEMDPTLPPLLWGDAALNSLALICQEGTPRSPVSASSRIVFLLLLMLSLFLTTSYSAIIVSLLQTSSTAINNLKELLDSSFTLSMRDIAYNTKLVNDTQDPEIKRMFKEKLYKEPYHQAFTPQEEGVENLRKGLHAFYGDAGAYKIMSDILQEDEKCRLKEITINPSNALAFPVKKGSQYKEHITQKTLWLREIGLIDREYKRWFVQRPKCDSDSRGFASVRIGDFYPTLVVLGIGIGSSILFLLTEFLYHKIKYGSFCTSDSTTS